MREIVYLGNSEQMVKILIDSQVFNCKLWICETRVFEKLLPFAEKNSLKLLSAKNNVEIDKILTESNSCKNIVVFSFGIIISENLIEKYDFYNFHFGSFKNNRGRNPTAWSILLGFTSDEVCLHKINKEIDSGILISNKKVFIDKNDTTKIIDDKKIACVPQLLIDLDKYINGEIKGKSVVPGIYRKKIEPEDYTIDVNNDSETVIKNKIRSQIGYSGAIVLMDGKEVRVNSYDEYKELLKSQNHR